MSFFSFKLPSEREGQRGINMVDLMMWLVIAALLLAAALQGISYYQKGATLYQMKNDAQHSAELVSAKVANNGGKFSEEEVAEAIADTAKTKDVVLASQNDYTVKDGFVIRSSHPTVEDLDVVYLSAQRGTYAPGLHTVPKGLVIAPGGVVSNPGNGNPVPGNPGGGTTPAPVTVEGGASYDSIPYNSTVSNKIIDAMNAELAFAAGSHVEGSVEELMNKNTAANAALSDDEKIQYANITGRTQFSDLRNESYRLMDEAYGVPNKENSKAWVDSIRSHFTTAIASPIPTDYKLQAPADSAEAAYFADRSVAEGTDETVTFKAKLPAGVALTGSDISVSELDSKYQVNAVSPVDYESYGYITFSIKPSVVSGGGDMGMGGDMGGGDMGMGSFNLTTSGSTQQAWANGVNVVKVVLKDNSTGLSYYHALKVSAETNDS